MKSPLISVITVVRNGACSLETAIASVLAQDYPKVEYIVVDGASTDGTLDILRSFGDRLTWISEPDTGIYDAMNKGLDLAKGEWIYFLGADDRLSGPEVLTFVAPRLANGVSLVFGGISYGDGRTVRSRLGRRTLLHNTVHHQGAFYHSRLFSGWRYDSGLRIVADYELNLLIYLQGLPHLRIEENVAVCGDLGLSLTQWREAAIETNAVRKKHLAATANALYSLLNCMELALHRTVLYLRRRLSL